MSAPSAATLENRKSPRRGLTGAQMELAIQRCLAALRDGVKRSDCSRRFTPDVVRLAWERFSTK